MSYILVGTKKYTLTTSANKPYLKVSNSYVPITTQTIIGPEFAVGSGYRIAEYSTSSTTILTSSSITNSKISSTTALTKTSTTTRNTTGINSEGMSSTSQVNTTTYKFTTSIGSNGMAYTSTSKKSFKYGTGTRSSVSGLITALKNTKTTNWYNHNVVASLSIFSSVSTHSVATFTTVINSVVTASTTQIAGATSVTTLQGRGSMTAMRITSTELRSDSPSGQGEPVTVYSGSIVTNTTFYSGKTNNSTITKTTGYTGKISSSNTCWY